MTTTGPVLAHPSTGGTAQDEREQIRALLLERRPDLAQHLQVGPSGALLIPVADGRGIEIGRMRRRGRARWVVAVPEADGARLREPSSVRSAAHIAVTAWEQSQSASTRTGASRVSVR
ncbi:hypothetical protein [Brachybacterium alimentarium]|uniref:hypothetical protein n=1 Tax=Brachybacterium alimentarium TaxID=47845 RepID=UPI000DF34974|nr:hypothetical protein [Brachybacterium alimentarium]RCS83068.1 hypothetical protein CIK72_04815 [Brachybacterium alimentarium]RCS89386.1 hypothetical protein CIK69_10575 [Brachybacterium alimentarium]